MKIYFIFIFAKTFCYYYIKQFAKNVDNIRLILINMHHILNTCRTHQVIYFNIKKKINNNDTYIFGTSILIFFINYVVY